MTLSHALPPEKKIRNPKHEIPNKVQNQKLKDSRHPVGSLELLMTGESMGAPLCFGVRFFGRLSLFWISDFGIRI
jgi:hypothetical protein